MSSILNGSDVNTSVSIELALQPQFEQYKPQGDDVKDLSPREILYQKEQEAKIQTLLNAEKEVNVSFIFMAFIFFFSFLSTNVLLFILKRLPYSTNNAYFLALRCC